MTSKRSTISPLSLAERTRPPERDGKLTAGVPLPKLIKRTMVDAPELVMLHQPRSIGAERFRRLKTILSNAPDGGPQVIVITSAAPAEGKSMVAANLALAFASDRQGEVLLLDADMRRPTVAGWLSPEPQLGLSELLTGQTEVEHVMLTLENTPLRVLPAGAPASDPVDLLSSDYAGVLVNALRQRFARVIIDTPPVVPFADADAIGVKSDGILLVARAGATRRAMLNQAANSVTSTQILGTVLNDVTFNLADRDHYHAAQKYHEYYDRERTR